MTHLTVNPHWVIYDTDPGVDDAMALYYALAHPGIKLLGITTTFGNVTVQQATANALYLTQLAGVDQTNSPGTTVVAEVAFQLVFISFSSLK